jgi:predicted transcriptional regulator YheO
MIKIPSRINGRQNPEYMRQYHLKHKIKRNKQTRNAILKMKYGITQQQYDQILKDQNGVCAICHNTETTKHQNGKIRSLSVDHDHQTNKVRGLLCYNCNIILGKYKENIEIFKSFCNYLMENNRRK